MRLKSHLRSLMHHVGVDIVRYPLASPLARTARLLSYFDVECIVDVGANDGAFAASMRELDFDRRIVSFEPLKGPYELLSRKATRDGNWEAIQCAIGDDTGEIDIHVSGNAGLSSSALPMLDAHRRAAPKSHYVGVEVVRQRRLDDVLPELGVRAGMRTFLKIDVQGYEQAVLEGASQHFSNGTFVGLQLELSLEPLYRGAMTYREALSFAESLGMTLMGLDPVLADKASGRLLQADAVFFTPENSFKD